MGIFEKMKQKMGLQPPPPLTGHTMPAHRAGPHPLAALLNRTADYLHLKAALPAHLLPGIEARLLQAAATHPVVHIGDDGYVLPMPYSMIQTRFEATDPLAQYLQSGRLAQPVLEQVLTPPLIAQVQNSLCALHTPPPVPVPIGAGQTLSRLNLRLLKAGKNGIDIHCENTFLKYLHPALKQHLYNTIDIENALSFVFMLQAPEQGGEFVLFNKDWNTAPVDSALQAYTHRHSTEASFFEELGYGKATHTKITLQAGDLIVFRAAQIWHSTNKIEGTVNRTTAGGFLAKSIAQNDQLYYWS